MPATIGNVQYNSPIDFQIGQKPPEDLPPQIQAVAEEQYNFNQRVIQALTDYCGIGAQPASLWAQLQGSPVTLLRANLGRLYVLAEEALAFGAMISLHNVAGVLTARNANATNNTRPCDGYCSVPGGITLGLVGEVIIGPGTATITGVTIGQRYYLSTANGLLSTVPAVAAGNIEQYLGIGIDTSTVYITPHYWIQH